MGAVAEMTVSHWGILLPLSIISTKILCCSKENLPLGWKLMLKAVALYRDGSKLSQPLSSLTDLAIDPAVLSAADPGTAGAVIASAVMRKREKLPYRRAGYTQKAKIGGHPVFLRTGEYDDGRLGRSSSTCTGKELHSGA